MELKRKRDQGEQGWIIKNGKLIKGTIKNQAQAESNPPSNQQQ